MEEDHRNNPLDRRPETAETPGIPDKRTIIIRPETERGPEVKRDIPEQPHERRGL